MFSVLLILHGLAAVALLGALTHQTISVLWPARTRTGSFVSSLRSVPSTTYTNVIVILFVVTAVLGSIIYTEYRLSIRVTLQDYRMHIPEGAFELKEHVAAIALGLLPAYWYYWRPALAKEYATTRAIVTSLLAAIVWYNFLVGHIVNDIRGFGS
ncbi:MAG TPA: hypothetical protein VFU97_10480 [Xanthobacteraceae bacterium]|nr:hypothetical protein [Xanthobacteraceae bacterium]